jgi:hypothetical protein
MSGWYQAHTLLTPPLSARTHSWDLRILPEAEASLREMVVLKASPFYRTYEELVGLLHDCLLEVGRRWCPSLMRWPHQASCGHNNRVPYLRRRAAEGLSS